MILSAPVARGNHHAGKGVKELFPPVSYSSQIYSRRKGVMGRKKDYGWVRRKEVLGKIMALPRHIAVVGRSVQDKRTASRADEPMPQCPVVPTPVYLELVGQSMDSMETVTLGKAVPLVRETRSTEIDSVSSCTTWASKVSLLSPSI